MPPHVTRKRFRAEDDDKKSGTPQKGSTRAASKKAAAQRGAEAKNPANKRKPTLYDSLDAPAGDSSGLSPAQVLSMKSGQSDSDLSSSSSEDEDIDDDAMFEDVPIIKRQKTEPAKSAVAATIGDASGSGSDEESSEDEVVFEDVPVPMPIFDDTPEPSGDLELTLRKDTRISLMNTGQKKGPTRRARRARLLTHCMHVQFLLWHNAVRNAWACDEEVQAIMISHVPPRMWDEIDRWRAASGLERAKERLRGREKGKAKVTAAAVVLESTEPSKDPLYRMMQSLVSWWKQRFQVTKPGLRKRGYMELDRIDRLEKGWVADRSDIHKFGERIENLEEFRICAQKLEGSRDVGAQLFTALIRGLGVEARLVSNLQPLGYGWNKLEEAESEKEDKESVSSQESISIRPRIAAPKPKVKMKPIAKTKAKAKAPVEVKKESTPGKRNPSRQARSTKVIADTDEESNGMISNDESSELSEDELTMDFDDSDQESVVNVDLSTARGSATLSPKFDSDLEFPIYWTEILSPVTNRYIPVDATVKKVIGSTRELIELLEPRGGKADRARQVMAYVIGHNSDGTAKDLTVRYMRKQMFPGRTKGYRLGVEKVAIRNHHGKVRRYEEFDWFRHVMSCFVRGDSGDKRPSRTLADDLEDATDLKPAVPEKKEVKEGEETLQFFKSSPDFVLERHLKREEALLPDAEVVRIFKTKVKGKANEEPVYRRVDVVQVKSAETWHKQGRAPIPGEMPLKRVPFRAATINRRRELAEAEAATGEKMLQGLYSLEQTEWIIPDPIQNGVIPKNNYGNIDLFAAHMCPQGAVHIPYRGAVRACKKLGVDHAEAVVDFEFGHRMAVPVIHGVVCAEELYDDVLEQIRIDEAEKQRKEDEKKRKTALAQWRKFLKGLRIVEMVRRNFGDDIVGGFQVFGKSHQRPEDILKEKQMAQDAANGGGFIPEGYEEDVEAPERKDMITSSFFPVVDDDDEGDGDLEIVNDANESSLEEEDEGGGFVVDDEPSVPREEIPDSDDDDDLSELESGSGSDFELEMKTQTPALRRSARTH